ncbi:inorganic phosphate transporter [Pseudaminobacter sp. 19-2017]|uniref:Phosphate transporter n=1 Tax=Pseudaminobacter soli (ex Zhang et al. 2022) TaxID=2831468 RepID=A0A942I427_9HYPH|nr:inorganic phosphate transporter [Pseudaminobacter soli]MBS3652202.1 inorganic phosphate transporter [Pseudaminobacter soli]
MTARPKKSALDKDLAKVDAMSEAARVVSRRLVAPGLALAFMALAGIVAFLGTGATPGTIVIALGAAIAAYMALNIGANDVANNIGPAVGAKVLTMGGALAMAAIFEAAGALIAGGNVVRTISSGIVVPTDIAPSDLIRVMFSALLAAAIWINLATWLGAPISTTHSIVGAVVGAGLIAAGTASLDWWTLATIGLGWLSSPVLGGIIAAAFLALIHAALVYRDDKIAAARLWVPLLIAIMAGTFATFVALQGLENVASFSERGLEIIGLAAFSSTWLVAHLHVRRAAKGLENRNQSLKRLFRLPLIISAALLSFAHGANDVANAVGPLAAIMRASGPDAAGLSQAHPQFVMGIGAFGISVGLLLYGPRLVRMVGQRITRLNPMRAFCIALSTALTVIVASWLGLPVSSTHTAVGAVFGVGFFREWYIANSRQRRRYLQRKRQRRLAERRSQGLDAPDEKEDEQPAQPSPHDVLRRRLVRRAHVIRIMAAWLATVPAAGLLSAAIYLVLAGVA